MIKIKNYSFIITLLLSLYSQNSIASSIDEKINEIIAPISSVIVNIVFFSVEIYDGIQVPLIVVWLILAALFTTIYFGFVNIRYFKTALKIASGKFKEDHAPGEVTHKQALWTACAATVGLGNIAGVAIAISLGGPGATFWMIVCGLLGMSTKFVECTLGVQYRDVDDEGTVYGGPMYYISKGLKEKGFMTLGKLAAVLFAIFCIGGSFGGGNAAQSNQAAMQLVNSFGMTGGNARTIIGLIMMVFVGIIIIHHYHIIFY